MGRGRDGVLDVEGHRAPGVQEQPVGIGMDDVDVERDLTSGESAGDAGTGACT